MEPAAHLAADREGATMTKHFLDVARTPSVRAAQYANGSGAFFDRLEATNEDDRLTARETRFIAQRDSFYMATVSETGWPYVQHRGGAPGFLHVLDDQTLAFADVTGNRQYLTLGNLAANDKVALFLMDYPARRRLKILAHAEARDLATDPQLTKTLASSDNDGGVERAYMLHVVAYDWNCPQHITRRFSEPEVARALEALQTENTSLRKRLQELGAA
jgi:uncharacterized protein